ncbi:unnamed protein product [Auanema sp. JU1783]|nr:unnamed protein product [Auanema sp. JU1783]
MVTATASSQSPYFVNVDIESVRNTSQTEVSNVSNKMVGLKETGTAQVLRHPQCRFIWYLRTGIGIFTVIALCMSAFNSLISITHVLFGVYLAVVLIPCFLLEFGYILRLVCGTNGAFCQVFSGILHFDNWRRGLLYIIMSIVCFIPSFTNNYGVVCGISLIVTGILYTVKDWEYKTVHTYIADAHVQYTT